MSAKHLEPDPKALALRKAGTLHLRGERVQDEAFLTHPFFDARDRVQVRYEMIRRHQVDGLPVTKVAANFGVSRQAFYEAAAALQTEGIAGLVPSRPGPRRGHKCTDALLDFVEHWRAREAPGSVETMLAAIKDKFGIVIHPRSIERALARRKKNFPNPFRLGTASGPRSNIYTRTVRTPAARGDKVRLGRPSRPRNGTSDVAR